MSSTQKHVYEISLEANSDRHEFFLSSSLVTQTGFFRLNSLYTSLEAIVLPALYILPGKIKIWSAGCSDGREPYSVAMSFEKWNDQFKNRKIAYEIRASDINEKMIQTARKNRYEISNIEQARLKNYSKYCQFHEGLTVQVTDSVAKNIQFTNEDIFANSPLPKKYHLLICTNVLFYYEQEYRKIIARKLIESLEPNGFLYLESVGSRYLKSCGLARVNSESHLYQNIGNQEEALKERI